MSSPASTVTLSVLPCMREWYERHVVAEERREAARLERLEERFRVRADEIRRHEWPGLSLEEAMDDARSEYRWQQEARAARKAVRS